MRGGARNDDTLVGTLRGKAGADRIRTLELTLGAGGLIFLLSRNSILPVKHVFLCPNIGEREYAMKNEIVKDSLDRQGGAFRLTKWVA